MTPKAYARALHRLEAGTLSTRSIAALGGAAADRLRAATLPPNLADTIPEFWWRYVEGRQSVTEADAIARASASLRRVVQHSTCWRDFIVVPDAMIWSMAGDFPIPAGTATMTLARYLELLEAYLLNMRLNRRTSLRHFVVRHVASLLPAANERPDETKGQQRYGRNAAIARACTVLLARRITRQSVAQTLKNTV